MNDTKLFSFAFLVKRIKFEPKAVTQGKVTASVKFLRYRNQMIFEPVERPASNVLNLNAGKSFTFGLSHDTKCALARKFIICVNLHQTDPKSVLSMAQVDVTRKFHEVLVEPSPLNSRMQVRRSFIVRVIEH